MSKQALKEVDHGGRQVPKVRLNFLQSNLEFAGLFTALG
jgi:hypothetical protein